MVSRAPASGLSLTSRLQMSAVRVASPHHNKHSHHRQQSRHTTDLHHAHHHRSILSGFWIVVEAREHQLVHRRTNAIVGRLNLSEAKVTRRVFNAVGVSGDPSLWSRYVNTTRM